MFTAYNDKIWWVPSCKGTWKGWWMRVGGYIDTIFESKRFAYIRPMNSSSFLSIFSMPQKKTLIEVWVIWRTHVFFCWGSWRNLLLAGGVSDTTWVSPHQSARKIPLFFTCVHCPNFITSHANRLGIDGQILNHTWHIYVVMLMYIDNSHHHNTCNQ